MSAEEAYSPQRGAVQRKICFSGRNCGQMNRSQKCVSSVAGSGFDASVGDSASARLSRRTGLARTLHKLANFAALAFLDLPFSLLVSRSDELSVNKDMVADVDGVRDGLAEAAGTLRELSLSLPLPVQSLGLVHAGKRPSCAYDQE